MNNLTSKSDPTNRRVVLSPAQRKLQIISRDAEENEKGEQRKSIQRRMRRSRSSRITEGDVKNDEQPRLSQRKLKRSISISSVVREDMKKEANTNDEKNETKADNVLELIELLKSPFSAIKNREVNKDHNQLLQRSHSDPSRKKERTGLPLRMQPKLKSASLKSASFGVDQSNTKKAHSRYGRKKELNFSEDDYFNFKSSPSNSRAKKEHQGGLDPSGDDIDEKSVDGDAYQNSNPGSEDDLYNANQTNNKKGRNRHGRKKDQRFLDDHFNSEYSSPNTGTAKKDVDHGSIDHDSFFQDAASALGDFHPKDRERRYYRRSKSQDALRKEYEQQQQQQQQTQSNDRSSSDGIVLHSSSPTSVTNQEEDDEALQKRRRSKRRSAGGMVRNHRTQEEYTGFFLTVPNEENVKHGYGITKFPDGRIFEGSYEKGRMVEGKMTYPVVSSTASATAVVTAAFQSEDPSKSLGSSGATYIGKFDEDGLKCGKGIYTTAASTFLGQFNRDEQHGSGILIYHDGTDDADTSHSRRFIGHWKDGSRNGYGREVLADGTIAREGLWESGQFTGAVASPRKF
jgi:hypothetical protein